MMTYNELRAAYQQGDKVTIETDGERVEVEVVGHKAETLLTGGPAVRVYIPGRGTGLVTETELRLMGNKGRSKAERNCFLGTDEAAKRGHHLGDWVKHRAHLYSAQCETCGAMLHADAHEIRGTAINSLTCAETVVIGQRILKERAR